MSETAFTFECSGESLVGVIHSPDQPPDSGFLVIVGGPQYRVGSHRQFVDFARAQCQQGRAVLRFDYRGMGDSSGPFLDFEQIGPDLHAAIDEFFQRVPSLQNVYCFGLCDAASAALMFCSTDPRVKGLVLLNPWVRTEHSEAQAILRHYYWRRFMSRDFWRKLMSGNFSLLPALKDLVAKFHVSRTSDEPDSTDYRQRMLAGAKQLSVPVLLILSGEDLTANEFIDYVDSDAHWKGVTQSSNWTWQRIESANHTFASTAWKSQVNDCVSKWLDAR